MCGQKSYSFDAGEVATKLAQRSIVTLAGGLDSTTGLAVPISELNMARQLGTCPTLVALGERINLLTRFKNTGDD